MSKYMLLTLIAINFGLRAQSQVTRFEYGLQGGLNMNSANTTRVNNDVRGILTGLNLGGHFKWNGNGHFGIKILLSYDDNGWAYRSLTFENTAGMGLVKADVLTYLNYLNMPVLAEYSFGNRVHINLDAGGFVGFLLSNKLITNFKEPLPPGQPSVVSTSSTGYHPLNYGVSLGFGLQVPIVSKIKLDFDIRNHTGLSNVFKSGNSNGSKIQTNCLALLVGLSFEM